MASTVEKLLIPNYADWKTPQFGINHVNSMRSFGKGVQTFKCNWLTDPLTN